MNNATSDKRAYGGARKFGYITSMDNEGEVACVQSLLFFLFTWRVVAFQGYLLSLNILPSQ